LTSLAYQSKVPSADLKNQLNTGGVASVDIADATEQLHLITSNQSQKVGIV